jgi:hypothetical protein
MCWPGAIAAVRRKRSPVMSFDALFVVALFAGTIVVVMASIEGGFLVGRIAHHRSEEEKESPVSAMAGAVLALLAFILAFTFGTASNRFDARKDMVREEANTIRTVWQRSDLLSEPDRAEAKGLIREYLDARIAAVQSGDAERVTSVLSQAEQIQDRLWEMAVARAHTDLNSDVATLYFESLNELSAVHASRVAVGLQMRIPTGIWLALAALTIFGMMAVGYQAGIAGSRRTLAMPLLAVAFASVIGIIGALDRPSGGVISVSQQPLIDLLSSIESGFDREKIGPQ